MSADREPDLDFDDDPRSRPAVRNYTLVCVGALLLVVVVLAVRGAGWPAILPLLAGGLAAALGWGSGPPLVLGCVAGVLLVRVRHRGQGWFTGVPDAIALDLVLAAAVLVYAAAQYRLQSLVRNVFPVDPRRRPPRRRRPDALPQPPAEELRSPDLVPAGELQQMILSLLLLAGLAAILWQYLTGSVPPLNFDPREWFLLVVAWAAGVTVVVAAAVTGWLRIDRAGPDEAMVYLQDQLWKQTRREQSRINRWLVWARLRRQRAARRGEAGR
jgi:hypothetical protein